jgi:hypothetical protein
VEGGQRDRGREGEIKRGRDRERERERKRERERERDGLKRTLILLYPGPTLMPSFTLITSLEAPIPNMAIVGVRASTYEFTP